MLGKKSEIAQQGTVIWHFTTQDARIKLKHLYPVFEDVESGDSNLHYS